MTEWPPGSRALVEAARVARLGTADKHATPHVVPICFVVLGDALYSVVDAKPKRRPTSLKRLRNLAENPSATVLVDQWDEDWSRLAWVMLSGRAVVITDVARYDAATAALRRKYGQYAAIVFDVTRNPLIEMRIDRVITWRGGAS